MRWDVVGLVGLLAACNSDGLGTGADLGPRGDSDGGALLPTEDLFAQPDLILPLDPCGFPPGDLDCLSQAWGIPPNPYEIGFAPFALDDPAVRHHHVQLEGGSLVLDGGAGASRDGTYQILVRGVENGQGPWVTAWVEVDWVADVPVGTTLQVRARSTNSPDLSNPAWAAATPTPRGSVSPLVLQDLLVPNVLVQNRCDQFQAINAYLLVEVELHAAASRPTPRLQFLKVWFTGGHCEG